MKKLLILPFLSIILMSCMMTIPNRPQGYLIQPELADSIKNIKTIGVIVSEAIVNEISADGEVAIDIIATKDAKPMVEAGTVEGLRKNGFEAKIINNKDDILTFQKGYIPMIPEIRNHFPGAQSPITQSKIENFPDILKNNGVDCILAVTTRNNVSSSGRKAVLLIRSPLIIGGYGTANINYGLFCFDGKPMFYYSIYSDQLFISKQKGIEKAINGITKKMIQLTGPAPNVP